MSVSAAPKKFRRKVRVEVALSTELLSHVDAFRDSLAESSGVEGLTREQAIRALLWKGVQST
jgi:hypothetical protein